MSTEESVAQIIRHHRVPPGHGICDCLKWASGRNKEDWAEHLAAQIIEASAEVAALEAELASARSRADDWRFMAIQLAATCRDLRNDLTAARWAGVI
jgi:hypothetical protein